MSDNENAISIDHRVNVTRTQPAIISLRRETLLDSHFEVRPLRVIKSDVSDPSINAVKVEVVNPTTTTWMRLERSFGDGTPEGSPQTTVNGTATSIYIDSDANSASYGKRKFFTYNLIDGVNANATDASLVNSTEVILPITEATECCWIYIDECTEVGDAVRSGIVKVSYGSYDGTTFTPANNSAYPDVQYIINQRKLFQVEGTNTYNIEYEEEYLHNFDADDNFGETEYEGMQWGLDGIQLSYQYPALYMENTPGGFFTWLIEALNWGSTEELVNSQIKSKANIDPLYDFYLPRDTSNANLTVHSFAGYDFCIRIIQEVNGASGNETNTSNDINILQLDEEPKSAIEYCFNKNKRNNKGEVVWQNTDGTYDQTQLNWYLPAIDEVEDIVQSYYGEGKQHTYSRFIDFQSKFYWSSQPAFLSHYVSIDNYKKRLLSSEYYDTGDDTTAYYYTDNTVRARATKVDYNGIDDEGNTSYAVPSSAAAGLSGTLYGKLQYADLSLSYTFDFTSGDYGYKSAGDLVYTSVPGNRPRTSMARVRCVRKIDTTTTE